MAKCEYFSAGGSVKDRIAKVNPSSALYTVADMEENGGRSRKGWNTGTWKEYSDRTNQ